MGLKTVTFLYYLIFHYYIILTTRHFDSKADLHQGDAQGGLPARAGGKLNRHVRKQGDEFTLVTPTLSDGTLNSKILVA